MAICYQCKKSCSPSLCANCQVVTYCSKECQRKNWMMHRYICPVLNNVFPYNYLDVAQKIYRSDMFMLHLTHMCQLLASLSSPPDNSGGKDKEAKEGKAMLALIPCVKRSASSLRTMILHTSMSNIKTMFQLKPTTLVYGIQVVRVALPIYQELVNHTFSTIDEENERLIRLLVINEENRRVRPVEIIQPKLKGKDAQFVQDTFNIYLQEFVQSGGMGDFLGGRMMLYFLANEVDGKLEELEMTGMFPSFTDLTISEKE